MKRLKLTSTLVLLLGLFLMQSCEDIADDTIVSPEDSLAAIDLVGTANQSLESVMDNMLNADPDSVQQMLDLMDFSAPHDLYVSAHELDQYNSDANFGMAFTGFLMISQDPALEAMLLNWESYFNANEPFAVDASMSKTGYRMPLSIDGVRLPIAPMIELPFFMAKMTVDDVPQFSEFQSIAASLLLPVVQQSIAALELVDDDPNYVFSVSAAMQGLTEGDPMELDLTEIYLIEGGLYGLQGLLNTVIAYNFDFVSFDEAGIMTELSQGSDFATLHSDGAAKLGLAYQSALTAFDRIDDALDFLEAETDDQSNDLIIIEDPIDYDDIRSSLAEAQSALLGPTMIHYSYWNDIYEDGVWIDDEFIEDSLEVDISQFFLNPISDFKAMLPAYTMDTELDYNYDYYYLSEPVYAEDSNVTIEGLDGAYITINLLYAAYDEGSTLTAIVNMGFLYYDLATANPADLPPAVWALYGDFMDLVDIYSGSLYQFPYISFNWSGNVTTGQSLIIAGNAFVEYELQTEAYVVPSPSWNATTYAEWLTDWPDPTMNNILPNMDAEGLARFLDFDEQDW